MSRQSDRQAAAVLSLFERFGDDIYAFCLARTGNHATAEDLVSMVLLTAWRRRAAVDLLDRDPRPWLFGVARQLLRNERRGRRRYKRFLEQMALAREGEERDPLTTVIEDSALTELLKTVRELPVEQQEVVGLCWLGELSDEEASVVLDVPAGTVRSRLSRARARLRSRLSTDPNLDTETKEATR